MYLSRMTTLSTGRQVSGTSIKPVPTNFMQLLTAFLKKKKTPYSEAENGLEALKAYQNPLIRYDFILMGMCTFRIDTLSSATRIVAHNTTDMSMPVMDGMSATRAIRQYEQAYNIPRCCIIALTGLASNSARLEAWNSGIDQYMTKPVNFAKLSEFLGKEKVRRESIERTKSGVDIKLASETKGAGTPVVSINEEKSGGEKDA